MLLQVDFRTIVIVFYIDIVFRWINDFFLIIPWEFSRERVKIAIKRERVVKSVACQGFLHLHNIGQFYGKNHTSFRK